MNLYKETTEFLKSNNKTWDDIEYILVDYSFQTNSFRWGDKVKTYKLDKMMFMLLSKDINYDEDYGCQEINGSLRIVGKDWWMTRAEYDGNEWWEFNTKPELPDDVQSVTDIKTLKKILWY